MKKSTGVVLSVFVSLMLSGCTTIPEIPLSPSAKESIQTVSVDPTIPVPTSIQYSGSQAARAISGMGLIGLGISCAMTVPTEDKLETEVKNCNMQLNQVFYQKFTADIRDQTDFKVVRTEPQDAQFKLAINNYGFSDQAYPAQGTLPYVDVTGKLIWQGKVVWQSSKQVYLNQQAYSRYKVQDYINDPQLLQNAFVALMSQASDDLVSSLNN